MALSATSELWRVHGGRCYWCNVAVIPVPRVRPSVNLPGNMATVDHYIPQSHGLPDRANVLVLACWWCNKTRGCLPARVWRSSRTLAERRRTVARSQRLAV